MTFTAWYYPFFLATVALLFWRLPQRGRIYLLLAASYVFYGYWDIRFLSLIIASTAMDFLCGQAIDGQRRPLKEVIGLGLIPVLWFGGICTYLGWPPRTPMFFALACLVAVSFALLYESFWRLEEAKRRKAFLLLTLGYNLGLLFFFKYFNFFIDSARALLATLGVGNDFGTLNILLPVGISFYTFQSIAYAVDIYRGREKACTRLPLFATFIAFFPQLVAGPIQRAGQLLPQLEKTPPFEWRFIHEALAMLLVGYFKKVFVGDNCAIVANYFFTGGGHTSPGWVLLGTLAFAFQIYGDFSGYTDMARGSARMFGVQLSRNFAFPYMAVSPSDFWARWHITLSTWIRDYLYIPLGGNRGGTLFTLRNLYVSMLLAGLWHGAAWPFVLWGAYHATLLAIYRVVPALRDLEQALHWKRVAAVAGMFVLTLLGWLIFRSPDLTFTAHALASLAGAAHPAVPGAGKPFVWVLLHVAPMLVLQWVTRASQDETDLSRRGWRLRAMDYAIMVLMVGSAAAADQEFIYFQF